MPLDPLSADGARTLYWRKRNDSVLAAARKLEISNLRYRHSTRTDSLDSGDIRLTSASDTDDISEFDPESLSSALSDGR